MFKGQRIRIQQSVTSDYSLVETTEPVKGEKGLRDIVGLQDWHSVCLLLYSASLS